VARGADLKVVENKEKTASKLQKKNGEVRECGEGGRGVGREKGGKGGDKIEGGSKRRREGNVVGCSKEKEEWDGTRS